MAEQNYQILPEHAAPEVNTTKPGAYTPTDEEKRDLKLVNKMFEKAKRHRRKYDEKWLDYYKMFRGKQWKEQRPSYRHSEVINFVFSSIQTSVPIVTDSRPKVDFLPQEPSDMEFAKILSDVCSSDWEKYNWNYVLTENVYDSHIYGQGYGEMGYNPKANYGQGAIEFESKDPFYCFPDPSAQSKINDGRKRSRSFIYAEPVDVEILKKDYPHLKDYIKPDLIDLIQGDKTDLDQIKFKSPVDNRVVAEGGSAYDVGASDQALKVTLYYYPDEYIEDEKDKGDGTKFYEQRLKYPNGRKVCIAGGVRLSAGPIPYDDGLFPFAKLVNYIDSRSAFGISDVEQAESPQKIFNKLVSFALDVLTLMGNPVWKVGEGAGVDTDNLVNRPGLIIEAADVSQVQREEGVQLQPFVLQLIDRMSQWFDTLQGTQDVTQGRQPTGVTAASAITSLQEAAQTRLRLKSRNVDAYLQDLGQLYKNRVFQFYSAPQIARLTNEQGVSKYFKMHIETMEDEYGQPVRKAIVRDFHQDEAGNYHEALQAREFVIKGDFDVRVATGSSLPFAKQEKVNLAKMYFDAGAITPLEFLKAGDYPNAEQVYQKKMEADAQAAAAQAQAQPPQGGPPPAA